MTWSRWLLTGALLCAASTAVAESQGVSIEDVLRLRSVREVALSPDGKTVAWTVSVPRKAKTPPGGPTSPIYVKRPGDKHGRRMTAESSEAHGLIFTPDGKSLSFLSKRGTDAGAQVYTLRLDGGEAEAVTSSPRAILGYAWSPDGKRLATIAPAAEDPKVEARRKDGYDEKVVDARHVQQLVTVREVATKAETIVTPADKTAFELAWSPDGSELLVMLADSPKNDDNYMYRSLWRFPSKGGKGTLLASKMGKMVKPVWTADGKTVAWLGAAQLSDGTQGVIWTLPAGGGTARALNAQREETVMDLRALPSGEFLALAVTGTRTALSRRGLDGSVTAVGTATHAGGQLVVDKAGKRYAMVASAATHPGEVFLGDVSAAAPTRASTTNRWLQKRKLGRQETIRWKAADGLEIEGVLIHPVDEQPGRRYPLVIFAHGGPESQWLDGWLTGWLYPGQVLAAKGYFVVAPNFRGSAGRGPKFAMANHKDLGGKELDDHVAAIDALDAKGLIDPKRVAMMGGSYGGYMSALAATKASARFAAAINYAGISNWTSFLGTSDIPHENSLVHWDLYCWDHADTCWKASALGNLATAKTPLLILHGEQDARVPPSQAWELYLAFKARNLPVELVLYPREGHGTRERAHQDDTLQRILTFLGRTLRPGT